MVQVDNNCRKIGIAIFAASGFQHIESVDCIETYASVAEANFITYLEAKYEKKALKAHQMDVETASFSGTLDGSTFVGVPDEVETGTWKYAGCKLIDSVQNKKGSQRWN